MYLCVQMFICISKSHFLVPLIILLHILGCHVLWSRLDKLSMVNSILSEKNWVDRNLPHSRISFTYTEVFNLFIISDNFSFKSYENMEPSGGIIALRYELPAVWCIEAIHIVDCFCYWMQSNKFSPIQIIPF